MNKILRSNDMQIQITDEFVTLKTEEGLMRVKVGENSRTEANAIMLYNQFISA